MVTRQEEEYSWQFAYLGANQADVREGQKFAVNPGSTFTYQPTPDGTYAMGATLSTSTTQYRGGKSFELKDNESENK